MCKRDRVCGEEIACVYIKEVEYVGKRDKVCVEEIDCV